MDPARKRCPVRQNVRRGGELARNSWSDHSKALETADWRLCEENRFGVYGKHCRKMIRNFVWSGWRQIFPGFHFPENLRTWERPFLPVFCQLFRFFSGFCMRRDRTADFFDGADFQFQCRSGCAQHSDGGSMRAGRCLMKNSGNSADLPPFAVVR